VASLDGDVLGVTILPHTRMVTNLCERRAGDRVNIEVDVLAKHVEKLLKGTGA
jgi:riboflavin synthase